jgi:hypothetical protein
MAECLTLINSQIENLHQTPRGESMRFLPMSKITLTEMTSISLVSGESELVVLDAEEIDQ